MSKLTERLRTASGWDHLTLVNEAADRIEHLERVLVMARLAIEALDEGHYHIGSEALAAIEEALKENDSAIPTSRF